MKKVVTTSLVLLVLLVMIFSLIHYNLQSYTGLKFTNISLKTCLFLSIVVTIAFYLLYLIIFKSKIDNSKIINKLFSEKSFLISSIIIGCIISFLIPLFQIPDEPAHLQMIYTELGDTSVSKDINSIGPIFTFYKNSQLTTASNDWLTDKINIANYFDLSYKMPPPRIEALPSLYILQHLPQAIVLLITATLNFPVLVSVTLCEFSAVIFYSLVCYKALCIMPIKKPMFAVCMLFPICIQQMGSLSYDAVLIPICFLLIAYTLYMRITLKEIKVKHFVLFIILIFWIGIIKIPYILLGLLIFMVPKNKININDNKLVISIKKYCKNKILLVIIAILFISLFIVICYKLIKDNLGVKIALASILNLPGSLRLFDNTLYLSLRDYIIQITGDFGWLDMPPSRIFSLMIIIFFIFSLFCPEKTKIKFNYKMKIFFVSIGTISIFFIIMAMVMHELRILQELNIDNYSVIDYMNSFTWLEMIRGPQGRYFVMLIPLFLIPFNFSNISKIVSKKINYKFTYELFMVLEFSYIILRISLRYWL